MKSHLLLSVLITISEVSSYCPTTPDPCLETTHSKLQSADDLKRSSSYFDVNAAYFGDFALLETWYRATTGALSGDMPTEAPDYGHCQALYPVWFNETFPTLAEGPVQRKACVKTFNGNCSEQLDICIKNCSLYNQIYNVYWLSRPSNANARYCFDYYPTTTVAPPQDTTTANTYGWTEDTTTANRYAWTEDTDNSSEDNDIESTNWALVAGIICGTLIACVLLVIGAVFIFKYLHNGKSKGFEDGRYSIQSRGTRRVNSFESLGAGRDWQISPPPSYDTINDNYVRPESAGKRASTPHF